MYCISHVKIIKNTSRFQIGTIQLQLLNILLQFRRMDQPGTQMEPPMERVSVIINLLVELG